MVCRPAHLQTCEQGVAQRRREERGLERARRQSAVPRGCTRSRGHARSKARPLSQASARQRQRTARHECIQVLSLELQLRTSSLEGPRDVLKSMYYCNRKHDSGGQAPFPSVSHTAARPHTPFLLGGTVSIDGTCSLLSSSNRPKLAKRTPRFRQHSHI